MEQWLVGDNRKVPNVVLKFRSQRDTNNLLTILRQLDAFILTIRTVNNSNAIVKGLIDIELKYTFLRFTMCLN